MVNNRTDQGRIAEKAMREAVKDAMDKQLKMGVPVVFMKDGKICYKMPDGSIQYADEK